MGVGVLSRYFLNLGGTVANVSAIKWGFRAPKDTYKNIAPLVGVTEVADNNKTGIVWGCNKPRPVRIRISYIAAQAGGGGAGGTANDKIRAVKRFCEPDLLNDVLFGSLNGKKISVIDMDDGGSTEYDIQEVTIVQ